MRCRKLLHSALTDLIYSEYLHFCVVSIFDTVLCVEYSSWSPSFFLVSKTNLAVHEDKNRVPYVKVHGKVEAEPFIFLRFNLNAQAVLDPESKQFPEILMGLNHLFALLYWLQTFTMCSGDVKFSVLLCLFHVEYEREHLEEFFNTLSL